MSLSNSASVTSTKESVFTQAAYSPTFPFALYILFAVATASKDSGEFGNSATTFLNFVIAASSLSVL